MKRTRLRPISKKKLASLKEWRAVRDEVLREADGVCQRCGKKEPYWHLLHVHHLRPRSLGGTDEKKNLVAVDFMCHRLIHDAACDDWRDWLHVNPLRSGE